MSADNPPAFPSHAGDPEMTDPRNRISCGGMSLRDWFAGQALAGMASRGLHRAFSEDYAVSCYRFADAMLAARKEPQA